MRSRICKRYLLTYIILNETQFDRHYRNRSRRKLIIGGAAKEA